MIKKEFELFFAKIFPFWDSLTENDKNEFLVHIKSYSKNAGSIIHSHKSNFSGIMIVYRGRLRSYIDRNQKKEITLFHLDAPNICIFSASGLIPKTHIQINIQAVSNCIIFHIPTEFYQTMENKYREIRDFTNKIVNIRLMDAMWIMEQVVFMSTDERIAQCLLAQSEIQKTTKLTITHEEIARHIGSAREVVSRLLKYLEIEGLISTARRTILLHSSFFKKYTKKTIGK